MQTRDFEPEQAKRIKDHAATHTNESQQLLLRLQARGADVQRQVDLLKHQETVFRDAEQGMQAKNAELQQEILLMEVKLEEGEREKDGAAAALAGLTAPNAMADHDGLPGQYGSGSGSSCAAGFPGFEQP